MYQMIGVLYKHKGHSIKGGDKYADTYFIGLYLQFLMQDRMDPV